MKSRRAHRLFLLLAVPVLLIAGPTDATLADENSVVFLSPKHLGKFPCESWCPTDRASIQTEVASLNALLKVLGRLGEDDRAAIEYAFDDRSVLIRDLDAANLIVRINSVCDANRDILDALRIVRWSDPSDTPVAFVFDSQVQRYQIQTLSQLISLDVILEASMGRLNSASRTLESGFAFAHNLSLTNGALNLVLGQSFKNILLQTVIDLQAMGVSEMISVVEKISANSLDQKWIDRSLWQAVCHELPILNDRERDSAQWRDDLIECFGFFNKTIEPPLEPAESERLGRQLQSLVKMGHFASELSIEIEYEQGGLSGIKNLQPGEMIRFTMPMGMLAIARYVEQGLDPRFINRVLLNQSRLMSIATAVEVIRKESIDSRPRNLLIKRAVEIKSVEQRGKVAVFRIETPQSETYIYVENLSKL